jgi:phosphohistidine swiveling domain-containing protein
MKEKPSTVWIRPSTKKQLEKIGEKGESYEDIILKLLKKDNPLLNFDLKGRKLYRQGVEARPFFAYNPYFTALAHFGKKSSIAWFYGKKNYSYWDEDIVTKEAKTFIKEHLQSGNHLHKTIDKWQALIETQKKTETKIKDLKEKTNEEILNLLMELSNFLNESWKIGLIIELFDPNSEEIIEEILNEHDKSNLGLKEFKILCSLEKLTYIQKETYELYSIAKSKKYNRLNEHAKKYFWISNSWADAKILTPDYFKAKITRLEQENVTFKKELEKSQSHINELKKQKDTILKNKKLTKEIKRAIEFFQLMTDWREKRKKWALISGHYMNELVKEISKRTNVPRELLMFSQHHELTIPLNQKYINLLKDRSNFCLLFYEGDEKRLITGEKAKQFIEEIKSEQQSSGKRIYGNVANPGKIEGIAKIIFTTDDLYKMQEGDILVSPCTRPEYVSAMKKASAILTDEGGITSHAAIVSRELSVPCIVGLRQATDLIKDGDKLEVNANHGIVIVKK